MIRTWSLKLARRHNRGVFSFGFIKTPIPSAIATTIIVERSFATKKTKKPRKDHNVTDFWDKTRVNAFVGHSFPDFIEGWDRHLFRRVGYGLVGSTSLITMGTIYSISTSTFYTFLATPTSAILMTLLTTGYWYIGLQDIKQSSHAVRRNYPLLGNLRYILETIRPEIRQYLVESDHDGRPLNRMLRSIVYQRAKNVNDTIPFGTRQDVYADHYEWACHSMWPTETMQDDAARHMIGSEAYGTTKPYNSSVFNISAMSYGALSDNAVLALNRGAQLGNFSHNTGEGGVSQFHRDGNGDVVWNMGTGYFGCGVSAENHGRKFDPVMFQETLSESPTIKMIEIKLSQGAKPGHGGLLPKEKISPKVAAARKLKYPATEDCHSPPSHSAFGSATEMIEFIARVREMAGGIPVGIKLCVGKPQEVASLCRAMLLVGNGPDFITVDGAEGGTGAAPPEYTNSIGTPMEEGLVLVRDMLQGTNLLNQTSLIASGRIMTGFGVVKTVALGANVTNAARGFMLSLGCIQALKCNTNRCPTGIATTDEGLMFGLDPREKAYRVYNFHRKTVSAASQIVGTMGHTHFSDISGNDIMRRTSSDGVMTLEEHFPRVETGCLLANSGPTRLVQAWEASSSL